MNVAQKVLKRNIVMILIILLTIILTLVLQNPNVVFIFNLVFLFLIVWKAKVSYFSIKALIINYLLFSVFFQYNTGTSYGILEISSIPLHYMEINVLIYIYNVITYTWLNNTNLLEKEKELLTHKIVISKISTYFCCSIAIICCVIAFPGMPFDKSYLDSRFVGLLQGNAWNHLAIVALLFTIPNIKKSHFVKLTLAFVVFWFLSHFERVDIIGLIVCLLIFYIAQRKNIKFTTYLKVGAICMVVMLTFVLLGEARVSNTENLKMETVFRKMLVQNTAADLGYVFNTSIEYYQNEELLYGKSYYTYFVKLIPLLESEYGIATILDDTYGTPGGEFILSEPLMNFGILGIILFPMVEFGIYHMIVSKKTKYRLYLYLFLIVTVFRTSWYGWIYIEKGIVYFIPILYIATTILNNSVNKPKRGIEINEND